MTKPKDSGKVPLSVRHAVPSGLLTATQVAEMIGDVSQEWVRRTVPHKLTLGHSTVKWRAQDVLDWIDGQ